jgi:hypothetical protein
MMLVIGILLAAAPAAAGQRTTGTPPRPAPATVTDIVDLLETGAIEVTPQGSGIRTVSLRIRRLTARPVTVHVPVGTFFVARNARSQNMVATAAATRTLATNDWVTVSIPVACANRPRNIPRSGDAFTIERSPRQNELAQLMPLLDQAKVSYDIRQAAVWIVTDNATFSAMGILVRGGARVIGADDAARAMQLYAAAGFDIKARAIWHDRRRIANDLPAGALKRWLQEQG